MGLFNLNIGVTYYWCLFSGSLEFYDYVFYDSQINIWEAQPFLWKVLDG